MGGGAGVGPTDVIPGTTNLTPGAVASSHGVSHSGQFQYSIPLWVVPGRRGMQPSLSIDYASGAPATHLGLGFSLTGESAISRCQRSLRRDGAPGAVSFDDRDAFCIDGQRLVLTRGKNAEAGATYVTEVEDDRRVVVDTSDSEGPLQWSVFDPSGLIHRYGVNNSGRFEGDRLMGGRDTAAGSMVVLNVGRARLRWLRETSEDRFGNGIRYEYDIVDGPAVERILRRIVYTTQTQLSAPAANRSVEFDYEPRSRAAFSYVSGLKLGQSQLLKRLEMRGPPANGGGPLYRAYDLSYGAGMSGEPLLSTVSECDQNKICKKPVAFSWSTSPFSLQSPFIDINTHQPLWGGPVVPPKQFEMNHWERIRAGDFDGDGLDDLLVLDGDGPFPNWFILRSDFGPNGHDTFLSPVSTFMESAIVTRDSSHRVVNVVIPFAHTIRLADTNFDNRADLLHATYVSPIAWWDGRYESCRATFTQGLPGFDCSFTEVALPALSDISDAYLGDFDGDGHVDLLRQMGGLPPNAVGDVWIAPRVVAGAPHDYTIRTGALVAPSLQSFVLDLNGDARAELLHTEVVPNPQTPNQWIMTGWLNAFHLDATSMVAIPSNLPTPDTLRGGSGDLCPRHIPMDINGDGLVDFVTPNCQDDPAAFINIGNGFLPPQTIQANGAGKVRTPKFVGIQDSFNDGIRPMDVNGDGRQDLVYTYTGGQGVQALVARADGTFAPMPLWAIDPVTNTTYNIPEGDHSEFGPHVTQVLDVNGDGAEDLLQYVRGVLHVYISRHTPIDYLVGVSQQGGMASVVVNYASAADAAYVGRNPGSAVLPQTDSLAEGHYVVRQLTMREGGTSSITEHHKFNFPLGDVDVGWLGFKEHTVKRGSVTTTFQLDQQRRGPAPVPYPTLGSPLLTTTTAVVDGSGRALVRSVRPTNEVIDGQLPGSTVRVRRTETHDALFDVIGPSYGTISWSRTENSKFDAYDNVLQTQTSFYGPGGLERTDDTTAAYDNFTSSPAWMIGLRTSSCTKSADAAGRSQKRCEGATYDPRTGTVTASTVQPGVPLQQIETKPVLDAFGNVERIERRDAAGNLRVDTSTYDPDFIYVATQKNALNHLAEIETQPGFGKAISTTDPNGVKTEVLLDGFGRIKSRILPGGEVFTLEYDDGHAFPGQGIAAIVTERRASRSGVSKVATDGFGREMWREDVGFGNQTLRTENFYDLTFGWLDSTTGPFKTPLAPGVPTTRISYTRDLIGRPLTINASGAITKISYDGVVETIEDPVGHVTKKTPGQFGPKSIERLDSNQKPVTTLFEYGPFGQLASSTQKARNGDIQVTRLDHDELGRLIRTEDEARTSIETSYSPFGDEETVTEISAGGTRRTVGNTFDELGRVETSIDNSQGFTSTYTWDTAANGIGMLAHAVSGDGIETEFEYDLLARPRREITTMDTVNGRESFAFLNTYDGFGRLWKIYFPPAPSVQDVSLVRAYDPVTGALLKLSTSLATTTAGTTKLFSKAPIWELKETDPAGRVTKASLGNKLTEVAAFDLRGRATSLTTLDGSGTALRSISYQYYANGNVKSKTDAISGKREGYQHDFLDRLETCTTYVGESQVDMEGQSYDDFGNFKMRVRPGETLSYAYGTGAAPHGANAVTELHSSQREMEYQYDEWGNQTDSGGFDMDTGVWDRAPHRHISYTSFNLPRRLDEASRGQSVRRIAFSYDAFNTRALQLDDQREEVVERGPFRRTTDAQGAQHWEYIFTAPTGHVVNFDVDLAGTIKANYLHEDALGTLDTTTDASGNVLERRTFTPFGEVRDPATGRRAGALALGFTGARHDPQSMVNLNGRIYDSLTARFLSKDPHITSPENSQSYNRYSYVWNMPLVLTDPTGFDPLDDDWSDAHGGATPAPPLGDGLDPIPVIPEPPRRKSSPSAIQPAASEATPLAAPDSADDNPNPGSPVSEPWLPAAERGTMGSFVGLDLFEQRRAFEAAGVPNVKTVNGEWLPPYADVLKYDVDNTAAQFFGAVDGLSGVLGPAMAPVPGWAQFSTPSRAAARVLMKGACFAGETEVLTPSGPRRIDEIGVGDQVWSFDLEVQRWKWTAVTATFPHEYEGQLFSVTLGGQQLQVTGNHPLCVVTGAQLASRSRPEDIGEDSLACGSGGRWVEVAELLVGDVVAGAATELAVEEVASHYSTSPVYNLQVGRTHTYAVGSLGILAHNKSMMTDLGTARRIARELPRGVRKYGKCMEFADKMLSALKFAGVKGTRLDVKVGKGITVYSTECGALGAEGMPHAAIRVGDLVFDNMRPQGIPYAEFIADLGGELFTGSKGVGILTTAF
ncbi:MAG: FG-GAP-like repeat-containing protein [Archangium sp.]|nr:FG-GAP-like repeat-containing protein [Archangium sp.]MDP3572629.1 FG-GAP-like repeat-containing protein [Archangium sp.]